MGNFTTFASYLLQSLVLYENLTCGLAISEISLGSTMYLLLFRLRDVCVGMWLCSSSIAITLYGLVPDLWRHMLIDCRA